MTILDAVGPILFRQTRCVAAWRFSKVLSVELGHRHFYFERVANDVSSKMVKSGSCLDLGIWV